MTPGAATNHRRKTELGPLFWHLLINGESARDSLSTALQSAETVPQLVARHIEGAYHRNAQNWSQVGLFLHQMLPVAERREICDIMGGQDPEAIFKTGAQSRNPGDAQARAQAQKAYAHAGNTQQKARQQGNPNAGTTGAADTRTAREKAMDEAMDALRAARKRMGMGSGDDGFVPFGKPGKARAASAGPTPIWDKNFLKESNVKPDWTGSKELQAMDARLGRELARRVATDAKMQQASKDWAYMDDASRLATLDRLLGWHAELAGYEKPPIQGIVIPPVTDENGQKRFVCGQACVNEGSRAVMMNTHPEAPFDKFPIICMSVVHEATHIMQAYWGDKLANGQVYSNDPTYRDHITFFKGVRGNYENGDHDQQAYRDQPIEIHARRVENSFVRAYIDLVNKDRIKPRPERGFRATSGM